MFAGVWTKDVTTYSRRRTERCRCVGVVEGVGVALDERAVVAGWRENLRRSVGREGVD